MDKSLWKHIHVGVIKHREHSFHVKYIFIGNWNAKVGSQETPGLTGRFGLGEQNEAGQRLAVLPRECTCQQTPSSNNTREDYTWTAPDGQYKNQIDYILCSLMEKLYTVSKNKTRS